MSEVVIREATSADVSVVAKLEDQKPLVGYMTMSDKTYVGVVDGQIVCVWGVMRQSLLSDRGYLWLLVAPAAEDHKFLIVRYSQRIVENLLNRYKSLVGECVITDKRAQKWMRLLGAQFGYPEGKTIPFQIERKHG